MKQYVVDAFTDEVFSGNPAAVCITKEWLSDDLMMNITRENNLSETAFAVREGEDWFRVSQVYREVLDRATGEVVGRELVLDNHSRVIYDPALIPQEEKV